jgi:hypothetical protein
MVRLHEGDGRDAEADPLRLRQALVVPASPRRQGSRDGCLLVSQAQGGVGHRGRVVLSEQTGEIYPPHLGLFVGDRFEDTECARAASLDFMAAARWREGEHIAQVEAKATEAIEDWERKAEKIRQDFVAGLISAHDARKALGIDPEIRVRVEPLDQASLDAALKITGVETRTVAVRELEPAEEFFYQGFLYEVTAKTELMLQARKTDDPMQTITFFDSSFIEQRQMSEGSIPWSTEVIANDKKTFKDFNG